MTVQRRLISVRPLTENWLLAVVGTVMTSSEPETLTYSHVCFSNSQKTPATAAEKGRTDDEKIKV